jgi:hypothetical protein
MSTDASYARRISSPIMKSSVISATNTQLLRVRRPMVSSTRAAFTTGIVSPDAVCNTYGGLSSLSGSPATMSGLATVADLEVILYRGDDIEGNLDSIFYLAA